MKKLPLLLISSTCLLCFGCRKDSIPLHTPYAGLFPPKAKDKADNCCSDFSQTNENSSYAILFIALPPDHPSSKIEWQSSFKYASALKCSTISLK